MMHRHIIFIIIAVLFASGCVTQETQTQQTAPQTEETKLVYAVHWLQNTQINGTYENGVLKAKGLTQYIDEYTSLNPGIKIDILQIPYGDYANEIKVRNEAGFAPDIYQVYSSWGVSYAKEGILDRPPDDIRADVVNNYVSTAGVTIDNEIWGIPTEINDYALVYNKALFKEAGIVDSQGNAKPPVTWSELVTDAVKTTKKDSKGNIVQYGFAFLKGNDWGVVDQFLSLSFTNDGKFLSDDYKKCLLNSTEGVEALDNILLLFERGATDVNSNIWDFGNGNVSMVIVAPWIVPIFKDTYGPGFDDIMGIAPMPYIDKPASLQYTWFMGVTSQSKNKEEAWKFLKWLTTNVQPSGTTRYGDLLTETIGAIPSRKFDIDTHTALLEGPYKKVYVEQLANSVPEPNVINGAAIRDVLRKEIESAWTGDKTSKEALDSACAQIDAELAQYYG